MSYTALTEDLSVRGPAGAGGGGRRPLVWALDVFLALVVLMLAWVIYQEFASGMPQAEAVRSRAEALGFGDRLEEAGVRGDELLLVYDLTGEPYFDERQRYSGEFEDVGSSLLDEFPRAERVRISVLQGDERYEGLSVSDGFGVLNSWF